MPIGEPVMQPKSKKPKFEEKVINISDDDFEGDVKKAFVDIDKDINSTLIEGDPIITIEGNDPRDLEDSVTGAFGADVNNVEVDWSKESKAVVAIAEQKLFADEKISEYMGDYEDIIRQTVVDMTTDEEQIRIFQVGLNAATDKAKYVEQATNKLVHMMKDEVERRIMENVSAQEGNA